MINEKKFYDLSETFSQFSLLHQIYSIHLTDHIKYPPMKINFTLSQSY